MYRSITFSSSRNQDWVFIADLLDELEINYKIRKLYDELGVSSQVNFYNKHDIVKFFEYINQTNDYDKFGLRRKYDKFMLLKEYVI